MTTYDDIAYMYIIYIYIFIYLFIGHVLFSGPGWDAIFGDGQNQ